MRRVRSRLSASQDVLLGDLGSQPPRSLDVRRARGVARQVVALLVQRMAAAAQSLQMTPRCWATEPDMRAAPPGCDGREAARQQAGGPTLPLHQDQTCIVCNPIIKKLALDQTCKTCNPSVPIRTWTADPRITQIGWFCVSPPSYIYIPGGEQLGAQRNWYAHFLLAQGSLSLRAQLRLQLVQDRKLVDDAAHPGAVNSPSKTRARGRRARQRVPAHADDVRRWRQKQPGDTG